MKLFAFFQVKPQQPQTEPISCCEQVNFDCNQGRKCPVRQANAACQHAEAQPSQTAWDLTLGHASK